MPKFFVNENQIQNNEIIIKGQDYNHIKKVLRSKIGDEIQVCNTQDGNNFLCEIVEFENNQIKCNIKEKLQMEVESNVKLTIFQGLPKADKMEYIIQKSVELGAFAITPVEMKRCVVKLNDKDKLKKIERWKKISEVASKQCGRNIIPHINNVINIKKLCDLITNYDIVLVAYEEENENSLRKEIELIKQNMKNQTIKIGVVIGPEGGLDKQEIELLQYSGAKIITLGKRILRTETVALNMLSIIMYELELFEK